MRNILLEFLPAVDTIEVINSVSAAVEKRWKHFSNQEFRAFLFDPNIEDSSELAGMRSFATVTADILETLGDDYKEFVQQLRQHDPKKPTITEDDLQEIEYEVAEFINFPPIQAFEYEPAKIVEILERFEFETQPR